MRTLKPLLAAGAVALATLGVACASADQAQPEPQYTVIENNARIPFANQIRSWDVVGDDTVILRTSNNHWYRAHTTIQCARELDSALRISLVSQTQTLDGAARFRVNNMDCDFNSIDEIQNPNAQAASR